jgi:hypothetical protein
MTKQINGGDVSYIVNIRTVWGGEDIYITENEIAEWYADPDLIAARHFGLTVQESPAARRACLRRR